MTKVVRFLEYFTWSSEEASTEDSVDSLDEVVSLDNDFDRMHFESESFDEEIPDDEMDSNIWSEIQSDSDGEFLEDHGIVELSNANFRRWYH